MPKLSMKNHIVVSDSPNIVLKDRLEKDFSLLVESRERQMRRYALLDSLLSLVQFIRPETMTDHGDKDSVYRITDRFRRLLDKEVTKDADLFDLYQVDLARLIALCSVPRRK